MIPSLFLERLLIVRRTIIYWYLIVNVIEFQTESLELEIEVHYFRRFFHGHCTAEDLQRSLLQSLHDDSLPLQRLLHLSMDGPNINKLLFKFLDENVRSSRSSQAGLIDIGTCNFAYCA